MIDGQIIVIDKVEPLLDDNEIIGRTVTAGEDTFKIKKGQGGKLFEKWHLLDENVGKAIKLKVEQYKPPGKDRSYPFISDFELVKDIFVAEAARTVKVLQSDSRDKSMSLSYAKDMAVAGRIEPNAILEWAELFYRYITSEVQVSDIPTIIKPVELVEKPKIEAPKELPKETPELPEFLANVEAMNYALSHGWTFARIKTATGVSKPIEIKDVKAFMAVLFPNARVRSLVDEAVRLGAVVE